MAMIRFFPLLLACAAAPLAAEEQGEREEVYDAMISCAAFHTIESTYVTGNAAEAQLAVAYDFAETATALAPDGLAATANLALEAKLAQYRKQLDEGDVREMAEDWTALESACREIYPLLDAIGRSTKLDDKQASDGG